MKSITQLIDPSLPEGGTRFDTDRATFTLFQAAMLWDGKEPAEDGFFREDPESRFTLGGAQHDPYQRSRSVYDALIKAVESDEFLVIPMRKKDGAVDGLKTTLSREQLRGWARRRGEAPAFLFAEGELSAVATSPTSSDVNSTRDQEPFSMSRAALIAKHRHQWLTIEADLKDASKNGLAKAKAGRRKWEETRALEWAQANRKLQAAGTSAANLGAVMQTLPARTHRLKH